MIVPPKGLVRFAAGAMSAYMAQRLRRANPGHAAQWNAFRALTRRQAGTAFGRETGIEPGLAYETFRRRVAPQTYGKLAPYLERMMRGEPGVLWPGRCSLFALSAATSTGRSKYLPVTPELRDHFRRAGLESLFYYTARVGHTGVFRGRHLLLGGMAPLAPLAQGTNDSPRAGDLGAIAAASLPAWAEKHLVEPGLTGDPAPDWPSKLQAVAHRALHRDVSLLAGMPNWVLALGEAIRLDAAAEGRSVSNLKALWPKLECFVHLGIPVAPFTDELRAALGPEVNFHEVYPAAEGFIAAQDADAASGLRLLADAGLFFEFLPMASFDEENVARLGMKVVPLEDVTTDVDYALLLTTPGGLCRYVVGDVVRFLSTRTPRLIHVGRTNLRLNAFGENVPEQEITDAIVAVCRRHGWSLVNLHVAPIFSSTLTGQAKGCHEWWIELKVPTIETPTANVISPELDAALRQRNGDYRTRRDRAALEAPVIHLVMPGTFEQWMRQNGRWGGHYKMPRCRSDRVVADQLAELSRFHIEIGSPYGFRRR